MSEIKDHKVSPYAVDRAVRLSYVQAMLGAIYGASTGGMFLIGYALKLGANNVQIGLMSTIPMLCVVAQLFSSMLVERGVNRRRMTIACAFLNVSGWSLIIMLPYVKSLSYGSERVYTLIAIISLVTLFAHLSGNARASWVGDLIPSKRLGSFFGKIMMFSGIVASVFAILEGTFLDNVKHSGIKAFSLLFVFGMLFGLINALLFVPQSDAPLSKHESGGRFLRLIRETFANKALMAVMMYATFWSLQAIAGPFYATYMLRDLKMPFLGIGLVNAVSTVTLLISSPFWGRIVDRYGCRPILIACTSVFVPMPLIWLFINSPHDVYCIAGPVNLLAGFASSGISVGLSTLIYKVTPSAGRSVQLAVYSIIVVLLAAPMPTVGGHLVDWFRALGLQADLRYTFYSVIPFLFAAMLAARRIREDNAKPAREMVKRLPGHLKSPASLK